MLRQLAKNDLVAAGTESIGDLGEVLLLEVGEEDSVVALRDRAASVELASDSGGKSHAGGGHASDKKVCAEKEIRTVSSVPQVGVSQRESAKKETYHCQSAPCR